MKVFQTVQKYLAYLGFNQNDQNALNSRQFFTALNMIAMFILSLLYLFVVANTPREYLDSIYMTSAGLGLMTSYFSIVYKARELFDYFDDGEQLINNSEYILP